MSALNQPCMVLNRNWQLTGFLPVSVAVTMAFRDQAVVLDAMAGAYQTFMFDEWMVHEPKDHDWIKTSTGQIAAPQMIVLKKYGERPPRSMNFSRPNLYRRDRPLLPVLR